MIKEPFSHSVKENYLDSEQAQRVLEALNSLEYYGEDHDLYSFFRTIDLKDCDNKTIKILREHFLSEECISSIEQEMNVKLKRGQLELHSLKLTNTHYLLPHDDQVQGRKIAFILNLTKDFTKKDGGALEFFTRNETGEPTQVIKRIQPTFNTFTMFEVSEKSFHQIEEVVSDNVRVSLSGWYYEA